jgi:hypothetical protein
LLTKKEQQTFFPLYHGNTQIVSSIFVRHAIRHGTYDLYSLGTGPSPDFPRPQQDEMQQLKEQVKGLRTENQNLRGSAMKAVGEEEEGSTVGVDGGSTVGEEDGSTGANGHPNGAPSAPTPEQAAATEESRKLLERQRKVLAAIHRSGAPVQAATTPYSAVLPQVRPKHRHARGGRVRTDTPAQKAVQQHTPAEQYSQAQPPSQTQHSPEARNYQQFQVYPQTPLSGYHQTPTSPSFATPSWPTPQYNPGSWNGGYEAHTTPFSMQQPNGVWNDFPVASAYDVPYYNSFGAQVEESYGYWYPQGVAIDQQPYGSSSASQAQAPYPRLVPAAATAAVLRANAHEFRPSTVNRGR